MPKTGGYSRASYCILSCEGSANLFSFVSLDPIGETVDTENVKEKLLKTVEDAKTTYKTYEEKCDAKEVIK